MILLLFDIKKYLTDFHTKKTKKNKKNAEPEMNQVRHFK
jgi:hypothetical protein